MLNKFEGFNYEEIKEKWLEKGEELTVEEISGLFGLIEAQKDRLNAIKEIADE
jgi:hypothetical protein